MKTNGILSSTNNDLAIIKRELAIVRKGQNILLYFLVGLSLLLVIT